MIAAVVAIALAGCGGGTAADGDQASSGDKSITIGYIAWDENVANSFLWKELFERQGYDVELKQLEVAALYSGVALGDLDVFMCATPKTHADYWDRYADKFVTVGQWYDTLVQGLAVPDYVPITSMEQLKGKAAEFDGKIVGIESGSGLMRMLHTKAVKDYPLDGYKIIDASTPAMLAALDKALREKKPILVTLWKPHWAFTKYPVHLLKDPKGSFGDNDVYKVIASENFNDEDPSAIKELARFHLTPDQLGSLELAINEAGQGKAQAGAKKWIEQHQSAVDKWVGSKA